MDEWIPRIRVTKRTDNTSRGECKRSGGETKFGRNAGRGV